MYISNKPSIPSYQPTDESANRARQRQGRRNEPSPETEGLPASHLNPDHAGDRHAMVAQNDPVQQASRRVQQAPDSAQVLLDSRTRVPARTVGGLQSGVAQPAVAKSPFVADMRQAGRGQVIREVASLRAKQAVLAYQSHQNFTERDHIATVLGIDEYA